MKEELSFKLFITSYVSLSVIAGLISFRLLNSLLDNVIFPIIDLTLLPSQKFNKISKFYNYKKQEIKFKNKMSKNEFNNVINFGAFIKDLIIWIITMIILYFIYTITI